MWLFQELSATLAAQMLTSPQWFTILQDGPERTRQTTFMQELSAAKEVVRSFRAQEYNDETEYFNR
jgi:hypothetical protein